MGRAFRLVCWPRLGRIPACVPVPEVGECSQAVFERAIEVGAGARDDAGLRRLPNGGNVTLHLFSVEIVGRRDSQPDEQNARSPPLNM